MPGGANTSWALDGVCEDHAMTERRAADLMKVREHSSAEKRCGPHVVISPVMLRSSNSQGGGPDQEHRSLREGGEEHMRTHSNRACVDSLSSPCCSLLQ